MQRWLLKRPKLELMSLRIRSGIIDSSVLKYLEIWMILTCIVVAGGKTHSWNQVTKFREGFFEYLGRWSWNESERSQFEVGKCEFLPLVIFVCWTWNTMRIRHKNRSTEKTGKWPIIFMLMWHNSVHLSNIFFLVNPSTTITSYNQFIVKFNSFYKIII